MKTSNTNKNGHLVKGVFLAGLLIASASQTASAVQVFTLIAPVSNPPSDCAGDFGQPFSDCSVTGPTGTKFSPIIAKTEDGGGNWEINTTLFPTVTGTEFSLTDTDGGATFFGTGSWTYTPTGADPAVRYWVAKSSTEFNLFWNVSSADATGAACATIYSDTCLAAALAVTTGTWITPLTQQGAPRDLSHISFYDTAVSSTSTSGGGGQIPEPSSLALLGLGMIASVFSLRRRSLQLQA